MGMANVCHRYVDDLLYHGTLLLSPDWPRNSSCHIRIKPNLLIMCISVYNDLSILEFHCLELKPL